MATKTFKRGQTLPTRTAYEERRRGRDFTFAGEQPRAEAQQPTFEEQANISTYAGPAISTPSGQLTFKDEPQRVSYIQQYEKALARSPNVVGGYSTPEGPVAYIQQDTRQQQPQQLQTTAQPEDVRRNLPVGSRIAESIFTYAKSGEKRAESFFSGGKDTGFRGFTGRVLASPVTIPSILARGYLTATPAGRKSDVIKKQRRETGGELFGVGAGLAVGYGLGRAVGVGGRALGKTKVGKSFAKLADEAAEKVFKAKVPRIKEKTDVIAVKSPAILTTDKAEVSLVAAAAQTERSFLGVKLPKRRAIFTGGQVSEVSESGVTRSVEAGRITPITRKGTGESLETGSLSLSRQITEDTSKSVSVGFYGKPGELPKTTASLDFSKRILSTPKAEITASKGTGYLINEKGIISRETPIRQLGIAYKLPVREDSGISFYKGSGLRTAKVSPQTELALKQQLTTISSPQLQLSGGRTISIPASRNEVLPRSRQISRSAVLDLRGQTTKSLALTRQKSPTILGRTTLPKQKGLLAQSISETQLQTLSSKQLVGTSQSSLQLQSPLTSQLLKSSTLQTQGRTSGVQDFFRYPKTPILPKIPLFGSIGEGYLQRGGGGKQANRYQASLLGLLSGKKQRKASTTLSGIEVRYPVGVSERLPGTRRKTKPLYLLQRGKSNNVIQGIEKQLLLKTRRRG